jgi:sialate O-acetylesterase
MRLLRVFAAGLTGLTMTGLALADVTPHPIFSDHMVLQRDVPVTVWGKADPKEAVTVSIGPAKVQGEADDKGMWSVTLPAHKAGTDLTLTIAGKNTVTFKNVAYGDVWVCSGQSNMEWTLRMLPKDDQGMTVAKSAANPMIRLITIQKRPSGKPEYDFPVVASKRKFGEQEITVTAGKWEECKPETVYDFSAVGYFFGKDIQSSQKIPVGLIADNWGGTPAEAWTSREALDAVPELKYYHERFDKALASFDEAKAEKDYQAAMAKWKEATEKAKAEGKPLPRQPFKASAPSRNPNSPSTLFNGMLHPIVKFQVKGAIWYQGESNAGRAREYYTLLPTMISDWRKQFNQPLPFFVVQLAPFRASGNDKVEYAELRDSQWQTSKRMKDVGTAIITDVGDETDIHPQQKGPVGQRLALCARAMVYGENVEYLGPEYAGQTIAGDKVTITFKNAKGLMAKGGDVVGFTVCGEDKVFKPAKAVVSGETIIVSAEGVEKPVAVRFGWVNFAKPTLNLYNGAGLPAVPFRTDDFPLTTQMPGKP